MFAVLFEIPFVLAVDNYSEKYVTFYLFVRDTYFLNFLFILANFIFVQK